MRLANGTWVLVLPSCGIAPGVEHDVMHSTYPGPAMIVRGHRWGAIVRSPTKARQNKIPYTWVPRCQLGGMIWDRRR